MEEEVEAEVLGCGRPGQGEGWCRAGGELEISFISEGDGIGRVSKTLYRINVHSFIVEVKLKRRNLHGKNISKRIKNGLLRSSDGITFTLS